MPYSSDVAQGSEKRLNFPLRTAYSSLRTCHKKYMIIKTINAPMLNVQIDIIHTNMRHYNLELSNKFVRSLFF